MTRNITLCDDVRPIFAICCACGFAVEGADLACPWCGEDLELVAADAEGLAALDAAWLDGRLDDVTYERVATAIAEARVEAQAEEDARAAEAGREGRPYVRLRLRDVSWAEAAAFVDVYHRHHWAPLRWKAGQGIETEDGTLVGVVMVGRPVARMIQERQPRTLEVTRLCVLPGYPNAGSCLLGWARRFARRLGATKLISYLLETESGVCYRAAGWSAEARTRGGSWHRGKRPRVDKAPTCRKIRMAVAC